MGTTNRSGQFAFLLLSIMNALQNDRHQYAPLVSYKDHTAKMLLCQRFLHPASNPDTFRVIPMWSFWKSWILSINLSTISCSVIASLNEAADRHIRSTPTRHHNRHHKRFCLTDVALSILIVCIIHI